MSHPRRLPRLGANDRVSVLLTPAQRDALQQSGTVSPSLGHALHRAPVREGKLSIRVTQAELDGLIAAAAKYRAPDVSAERQFDRLLRYLESLADRFDADDAEAVE